MKQTLVFVTAACGLAAASSTNNSTTPPTNSSSQPFELIFPKPEPTKEQPWTIKVVLSRINTKKSRFTGPSTTNLSLGLTGREMRGKPPFQIYDMVPASSKVDQSGPYNTVTFDLGFGDKYTGNDKRISDAITTSQAMVNDLLQGSFTERVYCTLFDDKGRKIALSSDPSDRSGESPKSMPMVESPYFPLYNEVTNVTETAVKIGASSFFFVWGTRAVTNVTCNYDSANWDLVGSGAYHVTLEDKPAKAGSNTTSSPGAVSYTQLQQNYTMLAELPPQPPTTDGSSPMMPGLKSVFPLPPKPSNDSVAGADGAPKGLLSGLKATVIGVARSASLRPGASSAKHEYSKVMLEVGESLRPDSRCQILDTAGKTISVAGEDGKAVTTFPMGRYTFHEPKRSTVGKILCGPQLGQ
ncbi:hypothetical protein MGG_15324 [Pyricularia oryzae 70-15]|uniref:Uncharacterized protein n=3 Tax=Pyricularia oryzae TaxID=318829 RepID=G4MVQ4_PYRO7|nr:uncharacterized protein MGG_15324 [Pyricularia oryzae 70-15]EHA54970.1 hypothetical protein MGG_15324 [Pyricularia oryzae 70-15]ELQ37675.1 hypothetical protein OOU_Y34scaffold00584g8 [Pyricularia oryzae Y34]